MHMLQDVTSAEVALQRLREYFVRDTHLAVTQLRRDIICKRQSSRETTDEYFNRFNLLRRRLIEYGAPVSDIEAKHCFTDGLMAPMRIATSSLRPLARDEAVTFQQMFRDVSDCERYIRGTDPPPVNPYTGAAVQRGKSGGRPRERFPRNPNATCGRCGRHGHSIEQCRSTHGVHVVDDDGWDDAAIA